MIIIRPLCTDFFIGVVTAAVLLDTLFYINSESYLLCRPTSTEHNFYLDRRFQRPQKSRHNARLSSEPGQNRGSLRIFSC